LAVANLTIDNLSPGNIIMKTLKAIKQSAAKTFLKKKNVVGTGIGEKWVNGKPTGEQAILVFVEQKISAWKTNW